MYNRYIPQSDGTFRRNTVPEQPSQTSEPVRKNPPPYPPQPSVQAERDKSPQQFQRKPEPRQRAGGQRPKPCTILREQKESSASSFLRNLLPRDLDTGDLLIIVLLLLMAGDHPEEQNNALLTLAIYLFM